MGIAESPYWAFIVLVLGSHYVIFQTDDERQAVRFCMDSKHPSNVIRTSDNTVIYCNIDNPHNC